MRPTIRWIAALALPVMILTGALVEAQKKPNPDKDVEKSTDKMIKVGVVTGKVMNVYEDKKKIRIQITYTTQTLDPGAVQRMAQARRDMAMARDRQAAYNAQNALAQAQRTMYKTESKTKEEEIQATDDVVVRMLKPKEEFDEKGKPKKYTKKEKAELKGTDKKLPGYQADFGDIATEQIISLTLVRKKGAPVATRPVRPVRKGKDKEAADDLLADNAPQASLIVILREPAPSPK